MLWSEKCSSFFLITQSLISPPDTLPSFQYFLLSYRNPPLIEKVGFKIPTMRYRKNSLLCGTLHIVDFRCGVQLRVARGIKGKVPCLTFDPSWLLSDY